MLKEFRDFALKGNVVDLAVGVIIGGAFGKVVSSLVSDVLMPPLGAVLGNVDFRNLSLRIAEGKDGKPVVIGYGMFINTVVDFVIIAFAIFAVVKAFSSLQRAAKPAAPPAPPAPPPTRECPRCLQSVPIRATRCAHCTSDLVPA